MTLTPQQCGWIELICGSMFSGKTEELIRRFPHSKYSKDGKQKIILINTVLAGKDMHVGYYYYVYCQYCCYCYYY